MLATSISILLLIGIRIESFRHHSKIFLLGDSGIGNYRLDPGQRLQDFLEKDAPGTWVGNFAEPGAAPLDFMLQYSKGALVSGQPQTVVIALSPDNFLDGAENHRLDDNGVNLRWIPWTVNGWNIFKSLSTKDRKVALVQQAGVPFYAIADVGRFLWIRYVQWPWERSKMRSSNSDRRVRIEKKSREIGHFEERLKIADQISFSQLPRAKDAELLLKSLRDRNIESRVVLLPFGNPKLIKNTCSVRVQAKHDTLDMRMRHWLDGLSEEYVDLNGPEEMTHFPDSVWDDLAHLKSPSAFIYISEKIVSSLKRSDTFSSLISANDSWE